MSQLRRQVAFTNAFLLKFIRTRINNQQNKEDEDAKNNAIKKYSAWEALVFPYHSVITAETIFIAIPDQPALRHSGWMIFEAILFLKCAFAAFIQGIEPLQAGINMVYTKPYDNDCVNIFINGNEMCFSQNKTTHYELSLMRQCINAYWAYKFKVSYQSQSNKLKSNKLSDDENDDEYSIISHQKKKRKIKFNKLLIPTFKLQPLDLIPYNNNNNNTNNKPPVPLPLSLPLPPIQNVQNKSHIVPSIIAPLHFGLVPTKPHLAHKPMKKKIHHSSNSVTPSSKKLKILSSSSKKRKKSSRVPLSPEKSALLVQVMGDNTLNMDEQDVLKKLLKQDLNKPTEIKIAKIANQFTGLSIYKVDRDDIKIVTANIKEIRDVLFPKTSHKKCYLNGAHAFNARIGGFEPSKGKYAEYEINYTDSYISKVFDILWKESESFRKNATVKINELYPKFDEISNKLKDPAKSANEMNDMSANDLNHLNEMDTLNKNSLNSSDMSDDEENNNKVDESSKLSLELNANNVFNEEIQETEYEIEVNGKKRRLSICNSVQSFSIDHCVHLGEPAQKKQRTE